MIHTKNVPAYREASEPLDRYIRKKEIKFFINEIEWKLSQKKRMQIVSCPRLSGKVSTARLTKGASVRRNEKIGFYRAALNTCPSFLSGRKKRSGIEE